MKAKLLFAALAAGVVAASGLGLGRAVEALPRGRARRAAERFVLEPGRALAERLGDSRAARRVRKEAEKAVDALDADRVAGNYTAGAWAGAGFAVCLVLALALGVSSAGSALALGLKVSLAFFFLQGAVVLGLFLLARR